MIITIDGPVASGKSTVAKEIAKKLDLYYLNTGLLYRAIAYLQNQFKTKSLDFVPQIEYKYLNDKAEIWFEGQNITPHLVVSGIDQLASIISTDKNVRTSLLDLQRQIAKKHGVVADGRDCGSVVFPNANFKFYLTASLEARAKRLMTDETRKVNASTDIKTIQKQIEERDKRDKEREFAPLIIPQGATIVDNSELTFEETVNAFLKVIGS